jgi:nucleotidyltransferase substrate binding protein (TIGR01987 family)
MIKVQDVRWKQRFSNYTKAMQNLTKAVELSNKRELSDLEKQGLIQSFEFTHELAWNVLKDYLEEKGISGVIGSKDASREAFKVGLIEEGEDWMNMIKARNLTSHTYNANVANEIVNNILQHFYPAFKSMAKNFSSLYEKQD